MQPLPRRFASDATSTVVGGRTRPRVRPARGAEPRHEHHKDDVVVDPQSALRIPVAQVMSAPVVTARPGETLQVLARRMVRHDIGCLVVREHGRVVGVVTERDLLREVGDGCEMTQRRAADVIRNPLITGTEEDDLGTAVRTMVENNVKRLPILRRGRLVGIVTFTDFARVEPKYAEMFRQALQDASQQARQKFEARLPTRPPDYTFI